MLAKVKEDELILFELMRNPINASEILFSDFDTLGIWDKEKTGKIRLYQYPMLSWATLYLEDSKISAEKNEELKQNLLESYNLGGRLTGKSRVFIIIDCLLNTFNQIYKWAVISSYDKLHIQEIFEKIINAFENHKILKFLKCHSLRSPTYKLTFDNGLLLESVNQNVTGKNPGGQFFGKHFDLHYMEEASYLNRDISNKMFMAQSEKGCSNRYSGMTNFPKTSPMGEIFFDLKNKSKIINLPSYVNPTWNNKKEADAIKEFGGKDSPAFLIQIEGKIIEGVESVFDIERIRNTYILNKQGNGIPIKAFEINKDSFFRYKEIVILDRPTNAESLGIYTDLGEGGAPSEYIIISKTNGIYKYIYRITNFQLSPEEEKDFIEYLIERLQPNYIGLDHTGGVGKSLYSYLVAKYPKNLIPVDFNANIDIDFERDENGNGKTDKNGNPIFKKANMVDWSMQCLKEIFYNKKIKCCEDIKLDTQINNVIVGKSKQGKVMYGYKGENHLFQAFMVFAICYFLKEKEITKPTETQKPSLGYFGGI